MTNWQRMGEGEPTARQLAIFRDYVVNGGSQSEVARRQGISVQTVKNHMATLYARLGATGAMDAALALGWVVVEPVASGTVQRCGWVGYCGRTDRHKGHHGGFRAFAPGTRVTVNREAVFG
jgi:DNA-binding CsgD family transcriptional regulator